MYIFIYIVIVFRIRKEFVNKNIFENLHIIYLYIYFYFIL